jgi:tRNA threonylcarbamoyladenosine biosynthesis protein TsaE
MTVKKVKSGSYLSQEVHSVQQTTAIAAQFGSVVLSGEVVAFFGELGSGKTFFIKAFCKAIGTLQEATSPSFTLINEYYTAENLFIYHFDFYRLKNLAELQNLGLDDFFYDRHICLVEWADKILTFLPERRWEVYLEFLPSLPEGRKINIIKKE